MSEAAEVERELKQAMKTGKVVLGAKRTLKELLRNNLKAVILSDTAPREMRERIEQAARLNDVPVYVFKGTSVELGSLIGKPFRVSSIGIVDPGDSRIVEVLSRR